MDFLRDSTDKRVSQLEQFRSIQGGGFARRQSEFDKELASIRADIRLQCKSIDALKEIIDVEGTKTLRIKKFIDKETNETVLQEIHETRTKRI